MPQKIATQEEGLGLHFFAAGVLLEKWYDQEPAYQKLFAKARIAFDSGKAVTRKGLFKHASVADAKRFLKRFYGHQNKGLSPTKSDAECLEFVARLQDGLSRSLQDHLLPVIKFAQKEEIDVTPLLRVLRTAERRCSWDTSWSLDVQDCFERIQLRYLSQSPKGVQPSHPNDLLAAIGKAEQAVMKTLAARYPNLCTVDDVANDHQNHVSRNKAVDALKSLIKNGYAVRPHGPHSDATLTELGERIVLKSTPK